MNSMQSENWNSLWREWNSVREFAAYLCEELGLAGKILRSIGGVTIAKCRWHLGYILLEDGLLLIDNLMYEENEDYPFNLSTLWEPGAKMGQTTLLDMCLEQIEGSRRCFEDCRIEKLYFLKDNLSLYAFPMESLPEDSYLSGPTSEGLVALGFKYSPSGKTAYYGIKPYCPFPQSSDLKYSGNRHFVLEPEYRFNSYYYFRRDVNESGESEKSEYLMMDSMELCTCVPFVVEGIIHFTRYANGLDTEPAEAAIWRKMIEFWKRLVQLSSWEDLFSALDSEYHEYLPSVDRYDLYFRDYRRIAYQLFTSLLQYIIDWLEEGLRKGMTLHYSLEWVQ